MYTCRFCGSHDTPYLTYMLAGEYYSLSGAGVTLATDHIMLTCKCGEREATSLQVFRNGGFLKVFDAQGTLLNTWPNEEYIEKKRILEKGTKKPKQTKSLAQEASAGVAESQSNISTKVKPAQHGTCPNCRHDIIWLQGKDGISLHCPNCWYIKGEVVPSETFASGAVRDNEDTPPYTLIPPCALRRLAKVYREGAIHYGQINYHKGIPVSNILNHAIEHLMKWLDGSRTEDHLAKVAWAMFTLIFYEESNILDDDTIWTRTKGSGAK
jgi:hypothetical protein